MTEPKKKRGRKPKNKIISNINPVFDSNSLENILITCIKKPQSQISVSDEKVKPNDISVDFQECEYINNNNNKCWNCSYDIEGEVYSHPVSYINNVFNMNGNFCSHECAGRYIYETYNDNEYWDKYYLLNFYVNMKYNKTDRIKIPLSKLRLIDYGGDLTIKEYLDSVNITYDCYIPPIVYVNNIFYSKCLGYNKEGEFKLFRKNKKQSNFLKNLT
jgi:hypothetical protein